MGKDSIGLHRVQRLRPTDIAAEVPLFTMKNTPRLEAASNSQLESLTDQENLPVPHPAGSSTISNRLHR